MTIAQSLLAEFEEQAPITRRFLERLPEDRLDWRPHPKSWTAGQLALHLAQGPGAICRAVQQPSNPAPDFGSAPQPASSRQILGSLDESIATVRSILPGFSDAAMAETFRLTAGGRDILAQPRGKFIREIMLSHWYQHRGQFSVYLRLLDLPVPASWGPSADEPPLAAAPA